MSERPEHLPTLAAIRKHYLERGRPLPHEIEASLRADPRPGARAILAAIPRRSFAPLREVLGTEPVQTELFAPAERAS